MKNKINFNEPFLTGNELEMLEIWEHFGIDFPNPDDRMKLKFVKYESKEMQRG